MKSSSRDLAFTITTVGATATAVGTNQNDSATITSGIASVTAQAFEGEDFLSLAGAQVNSSVTMGDGNDILFAGTLASSDLRLNAGRDIVTVNGNVTTGSIIGGGKKVDIITVSGNVTSSAEVRGGKGADIISITGNVASLGSIHGGKGGDTITVGGSVAANSSVYGGKGDDIISISSLGGQVFGGDGGDTINAANGTGSIYGEDGDDTLSSAAGGNIYAGAGDDTVNAANITAQRIFLGDGADHLNVTASTGGTVFDFSVGVDVIDYNDGVVSANGGTNVVFQAGGNIGLNATVYELNTATFGFVTSGDLNVALFAGNGIGFLTANATGTLGVIAYTAGNVATLYNVAIAQLSNAVTGVVISGSNITLNSITANSLTAADFV